MAAFMLMKTNVRVRVCEQCQSGKAKVGMAILSRNRGEMNEWKHEQTREVNPGQCKLQAGLETRRPEEKLEKSTRIPESR